MNSITIMGRLTKAPELKTTAAGTNYCNFTVAVDRQFKKDANKIADFFSCTAWSAQAQLISKYFDKGSKILVQGSMQSRSYEKNGEKRTAWDLNVEKIYFVDSKTTETTPATQEPPPVIEQEPGFAPEVEIDDFSNLPFEM